MEETNRKIFDYLSNKDSNNYCNQSLKLLNLFMGDTIFFTEP